MGKNPWSDKHYTDRVSLRSATGSSTFAYHDSLKSKPASEQKIHPTLEPKGVKVRESRDSDTHPESLAIATLFDVTGSMRSVPSIVQAALPKLMGLLVRRGILHPHIMVGAIGDATSDDFPLQIGQFESGIEIEDNLTNLILEGGGGGSCEESYEIAMWFMANHTSIDCFDKRGKRGYLFLVGDEMPYRTVEPSLIERILGDRMQSPIPTVDLVVELQKRYDVYYVMPNMTSHYKESKVVNVWKGLLGQNVLMLDDPNGICELIASTVSLGENGDLNSIEADLKSAGTNLAVVGAVTNALADVAKAKEKHGPVLAVAGSGAGSGIETL